MSAEFGVTSGHSLYSTHRFREDTKHMVILETLVKTDAFELFQYDLYTDDGNSHNRTRLYLTEDAYAFTLRMEEKGYIRIIHHASVINGYIVEDRKRKKKNNRCK